MWYFDFTESVKRFTNATNRLCAYPSLGYFPKIPGAFDGSDTP